MMAVEFPNRSRSFDEVRNAVRFIGYDGMFEIRFFVEAEVFDAPATGDPEIREAACLSAFDSSSSDIHDAAQAAHARKRSDSHTLTVDDFR